MKRYFSFIIILFSFESIAQKSCNLICNGNFEFPNVSPSIGIIPSIQTQCWQTTAPDGKVELWSSGFWGVTSFSGNQHLELNANYVSTVYQNFTVAPNTPLEIKFAHRGRAGIDTMSVSFGPVSGPFTTLGVYADSTVWSYYTINLIVPNSGNNYSLRFNSIYATLGLATVGNFIDSVTVCINPLSINEHSETMALSVFPNPFHRQFQIILPETVSSPVKITISDLQGKVMYREVHSVTSNRITDIEFNTPFNGIYLLKAECEGRSYINKLVRLEF